MRRGLVIGKFMPLHQGHCALIRFAAVQCDELIVSMTYKHDDPIPGLTRFEWIKEEFKNEPAIRPEISVDDFDDESLPLSERIPLWLEFLSKRFPRISIIISSEAYGNELGKALAIPHFPFDPERKKVPVSGSLIRENPFRYWDFIAQPARSYFVKRICFYGPESTGKSTMAKHFADRYHTEFVPEVSRELISSNDFTVNDIIRIGKTQTERVIEKSRIANKLLFCDTDLITTEVYCRHYLGDIPPVLLELEHQITYDQYFLFDIDVPWVADGLRDLGNKRREMFELFKLELERRKIRYQIVKGNFADREKQIAEFVDRYFL
ncbi:MAG: AAA family ATPase [Cyclobacteriaceae bacterium]|nr:AAA family ATPase [Cyclobacteriaceae bacterium]